MFRNFNTNEIENGKKQFIRTVKEITQEDVLFAYHNALSELYKLNDEVPENLKEVWQEIMWMLKLLEDYVEELYFPEYFTISVITGTFIYLTTPREFAEELVPITGLLDSIVIAKIALEIIEEDLEKYKSWKKNK